MNRFVMASSSAIVMLMVLSLSFGKANAENWMFWQYSAFSDDGKYREYPKILGVFDSYASCKDEEKTKCESLGGDCKKVSGGICESKVKLFEYVYKGKPASHNYYDCWKCFPQGMVPN